MGHVVTLIPRDGIGPEVSAAVVRVLDRAGAPVAWERHVAGSAAIAAGEDALPTGPFESIRADCVALKGPITTPVGGGFRSVNVEPTRQGPSQRSRSTTPPDMPDGKCPHTRCGGQSTTEFTTAVCERLMESSSGDLGSGGRMAAVNVTGGTL